MIEDVKDILRLFDEIDTALTQRMNMYLIGGGAMMFNNNKSFTKDLDMIVREKDEFLTLEGLLMDIGFTANRPTKEYCRFNLSNILIRDDGYRIDLFHDKVCKKLHLSGRMANRSVKRYEGDRLTVFSIVPSDIFVFKSITDRAGDLTDCHSMIDEMKVDWNIVLEEIEGQVEEGEDVWITWFYDRIATLSEKFDLYIPILDRISKMNDRFLERWEEEMISKLPEDER